MASHTSAAARPIILLVGGGWHTPASYSKLTDALGAAGQQVHCPPLPSMTQERPPTKSLAEDSSSIRAYAKDLIKANPGRRIVAVLHSYGGQVGTNSLVGLGLKAREKQGLSGGISDLVYLCAFALPEGGSMAGKVKDMGHEALMPIAFDFADDMSCLCRDPKGQLVGSGVGEQELQEYVATLRRWNGQAMYDAISHCAWREIAVTYIYAANDMTVPLEYQTSMVALLEEQGQAVTTYEIQTGHCPNLTAVNEVVDVIQKVVAI